MPASFFELFDPSAWHFGEPAWLRALYALPLVVLLYLLRRRARRFLVPHLPLWEEVLEKVHRTRPTLWRTLLAILLQLSILGGLILVLAAPYTLKEVPEAGHTIIILDRSLGTAALDGEGVSLAERVIERGMDLRRRAATEGSVAVALLSEGEVRPLADPLGDPLTWDLPAPAGGRPLETCAAWLAELKRDAATRILLVTPFEPGKEARSTLQAAGVTLLGVGAVPANGGIRGVTRGGGGLEVVVDTGAIDREVRLLEGDRVVRSVEVPAGALGLRVKLALPGGGTEPSEVRLHPGDAFPLDDRAPLILEEEESIPILLVADRATPHLDAFLRASSSIDRARSGRIGAREFRGPEGSEVVVLVEIERDLPLPPGRYLILGGRIAGLPITSDPLGKGPAQPLSVRKEDPLVGALDLAEWAVHEMPRTRADPGVDVVVEGSLGPLISRGEKEGVRFIHLAVPPDPRASSFPLMTAFPLFLEAALKELSGRRRTAARLVLRSGGVLHLLPGEDPHLLVPGGGRLPLLPRASGSGHLLPERVGRFLIAGREPPRRIALALLDHPGLPAPALAAEDPVPDLPTREEHTSLAPSLLLVLFGLLLLEWFLYQRLVTD